MPARHGFGRVLLTRLRPRNLGNLTILGLVIVNVGLYAICAGALQSGGYPVQLVAEVLSSSALVLLSCSLVLANRPRFLERHFGGLDRMYRTHRALGLSGLILLFLHFFLIPDLSSPDSLGRTLGKLALIGLTGLVALALAPRVPVVGGYFRLAYHHWRFTHRFIGLFVIVGFVHYLIVEDLTAELALARWYWNPIVVIGIGAYVYKELVAPRLARRDRRFVVREARRLNAATVEVALVPQDGSLNHTAGQFAYVRFPGDKQLAEPHPFTISSAPGEEDLRLSIKTSGDWTGHLYRTLSDGAPALIDGPYGRFWYRRGNAKQIWIAGGIGVTPFLSWIRDSSPEGEGFEVDFVHTVRAPIEAPFWREIRSAARKRRWLNVSLNVSSADGQVTAQRVVADVGDDIGSRSIYLCGPPGMVESLSRGFRRLGVPGSQIHSEEFSFR